MSLESRQARKIQEALTFQRRISLIETFCGQDADKPLAETVVETGEVSREVPVIEGMIRKNPLLTLLRRGGEA